VPQNLVLIGLGANLGDAAATLVAAMAELGARVDARGPVACSSLWRSTPVDCPPDAPDFLNAALAFEAAPGSTPERVLALLLALERSFGRRRDGQRNAPRTLDLDLLAFGAQHRASVTLTLPHPRATQRAFVLAPLAEIAPEFVWPGTDATVAELLARLADRSGVQRLAATGSCPA
jgi:2-amino-4-hydroxy-6-hydroxymethyldihydropteridine diphosphokinase